MNEDLKKIIKKAIDALVLCAFEAEAVSHADNPRWLDVSRIIDESLDDLREVEADL